MDSLKENHDLEEPDLDVMTDVITDPTDAVGSIKKLWGDHQKSKKKSDRLCWETGAAVN